MSTSSNQSLVSQAVAEIHLGRAEEAEAALKQALGKDPKDAEAIVNSLVLEIIAGKDAKQLKAYVVFFAPGGSKMLTSYFVVTSKARLLITTSCKTSKRSPHCSTKRLRNTRLKWRLHNTQTKEK